jgi:signal transduction histidine kinase
MPSPSAAGQRVPLVLPATAVLALAAALAATFAAPHAARVPVAATALVAAVLLTVAVGAVVRARRQAKEGAERIASLGEQTARLHADLARVGAEDAWLRDRVGALEAETGRLRAHAADLDSYVARVADELLPALVARLRSGASAGTALAAVPVPEGQSQRRLLESVARELAAGERLRAAAMAACANAAGRVQALATTMLADLREMEQRHGEEVLGDLLKLDHATAQAGRLADSIAVLTGARSGRRWTKPIGMESILRGAMGRISAYQRVRWHSTCTAAVAGHAAEGVMHALAELMDNATSFSPPTEEVHVYVEETAAGVVVTVEDGGLVMNPEKLERARRIVAAGPQDLASMPSTRLGLPVVGALARKHRLTVSFRPSSRGGTGAVVLIPRELITQVREPVTAALPGRGATAAAPAAPVPAARTGRERGEDTGTMEFAPPAARTAAPGPAAANGPAAGPVEEVHGLPKRPRGRTLAAAQGTPAAPAAPSGQRAPQPRTGSGDRFRAFRQALRDGAQERSGEGTGAHDGPDGD